MIAVICIVEACMSYNALITVINPMQVICYFSSYRILSKTYLNFDPTDQELKYYANELCQSNTIFYFLFQLISL